MPIVDVNGTTPLYIPRSRSGMMSDRTLSGTHIAPAPPIPWIQRHVRS